VEEGIGTGFILLGIVVCLGLSAFFSSSETAFFSLTRSRIAELKESRDGKAQRVIRLLDHPKQLLITILTGNALVNVAIAVLAALLAIRLARTHNFPVSAALIVEVFVVTAVLLLFGEITPKIIAIKYAETWALWTALPIEFCRRLLFPITWVLNLISAWVSRALRVERERFTLSEDEIRTLVEVSEERGALEEDEKEMIQGIFEISEKTVKEIMVPRVDIVCLPITATAQDVIRVVKEKGHSRIPIYNENLDNIAGLIHVKDLLPFAHNGNWEVEISTILREANFVPEGKKIDDLLRQFQQEKTHMAIVVDEYGGTSGLVTLEDVLEEIVGEIQDEYDRELPLYQKIGEDIWLVDARINIEELNDLLGDDLIPESDDYETLGGFIFAQTGDLPEIKQVITFDNLTFTVEDVIGKRIGRIRIEKHHPEDGSSGDKN
jgi:gliding motility-associated protein GldE